MALVAVVLSLEVAKPTVVLMVNEEGEKDSERGKESRSDSNCDENSNCRRKPFILRLGPQCHLTSSFRDLRLFLELAPRGFVSLLLPFLSFFHLPSRIPLSASTLPLLSGRPRNPSAAKRRCSRCTYAIRRHVSAIFCAADGSCRDRPTNASNIPAHRVSPSLAASSRNGIPCGLMFFSPARDPCRLIALTRHLSATRANRMHAPVNHCCIYRFRTTIFKPLIISKSIM